MTLYDFLYIDQERMHSLYAQLNSGLLHSLESLSTSQSSKSNSYQNGGEPDEILGLKTEEVEAEGRKEYLSPHDIILHDVLITLQEKALIKAEHDKLSVGDFVLIEGTLSFLDYELAKEFIDVLPDFTTPDIDVPEGLNKNDRRKLVKAHQKKHALGTHIIKLMTKMMPWEVQMTLEGQNNTSWAVIDKKKLRDTTAGLTLMHGPCMSGKWSILGIVDQPQSGQHTSSISNYANELAEGLSEMSQVVKDTLGCKAGTIGVTPLLLFRKLG